jgi:hypothetical protein
MDNTSWFLVSIRATWGEYEQVQQIREENRRYPKLAYFEGVLELQGSLASFTPEILSFIDQLLITPDSLVSAMITSDSLEEFLDYGQTKQLLDLTLQNNL